MIFKINKTFDGKKVIALCDENIIGKKIEEQNKQLDLTSDFYKGKDKTISEIRTELSNGSFHLNVVGPKAIELCLSEGLISPENIFKIDNTPYAQAIIERE